MYPRGFGRVGCRNLKNTWISVFFGNNYVRREHCGTRFTCYRRRAAKAHRFIGGMKRPPSNSLRYDVVMPSTYQSNHTCVHGLTYRFVFYAKVPKKVLDFNTSTTTNENDVVRRVTRE